MSSESRGTGSASSAGESFEGVFRLDVLSSTLVDGRILMLSRMDAGVEHSFTELVAVSPQDFSFASVELAAPDACPDPATCDLALALTTHHPDLPLTQFPLRDGAKWTTTWEGVKLAGRSQGLGAMALNGTVLPGHPVLVEGGYEETEYGYTVVLDINAEALYLPDVAMMGAINITVEGSATGDDFSEEFKLEERTLLKRAERQAPIPLPEAFRMAGVDVSATPEPDLGTIHIQPGPDRFESGTEWTFVATGATDPDTVAWQLVRFGALFDTDLEAEGEGPTLTMQFRDPGEYLLMAAILDDEGEPADLDYAWFVVDQTLTGTGACSPGASVAFAAEDDELCEGLAVPLRSGDFVLEGTATYPGGQAVLPCGSLAFYNPAGQVARSYTGLEGDAAVAIVAEVEEDAAWELRWLPTASTGGEVEYEVRITTLVDEPQVPVSGECEV